MSIRVDLTPAEAVQLLKEQGYIVAWPLKIVRTRKCLTICVAGGGGIQPVRIHRNADGSYRTMLDCGDGSHSNDPVVAKRVFREKKLRAAHIKSAKRT